MYYHAPEDVRDGLIDALLETEKASEAEKLLSCLAMQGDDKVLETFLELDRHPRAWWINDFYPSLKSYYVNRLKEYHKEPNLSAYAEDGGWAYDEEGHRINLHYDTRYCIVKGVPGEASPVHACLPRKEICPHCGGKMVDVLVVDGRD